MGLDGQTPGSMTASVAKSPVNFPLNTLTVLLSHFRQFKWLIRSGSTSSPKFIVCK